MRPSSPRVSIGLSRHDAAKVIGIHRETLHRYELDRDSVSVRIRERIESFYSDLATAARRAAANRAA